MGQNVVAGESLIASDWWKKIKNLN
jgi:hypothetical protein